MATLSEDIAALANDEEVMWAVRVLTDKGINGVMFEKLIGRPLRNEGFHLEDPRH